MPAAAASHRGRAGLGGASWERPLSVTADCAAEELSFVKEHQLSVCIPADLGERLCYWSYDQRQTERFSFFPSD